MAKVHVSFIKHAHSYVPILVLILMETVRLPAVKLQMLYQSVTMLYTLLCTRGHTGTALQFHILHLYCF